MNLLNSVLVQLSTIHPFTQILCVVTLASLAIVFLWSKIALIRKKNREGKKLKHPFFTKSNIKPKTDETHTPEETILNRNEEPVRKNSKKGEFHYPESTESQTKKRETLSRIEQKQPKLAYEDVFAQPVPYSYLNKEKNDSETELRDYASNTAKATPYFGDTKHSHSLHHEAAPYTSDFSMRPKLPKPKDYYMDTPSKKKEQEIEQKRNDLPMPVFSSNKSAFKKFENTNSSEKPILKVAEKLKEKAESFALSGQKPEKVDKKDLLLSGVIKIQKKGKKQQLRKSSEEEEEERSQKVVQPTKRIKKELTKEKLAEIKKKRKNYYNKSEESSDSDNSFDDGLLPQMPNRHVFIKKALEAEKKQAIERKIEEPEKTAPKKIEALPLNKIKKPESIERPAREKSLPKEAEETFQKKKIKPNSEENAPAEPKIFGGLMSQNITPTVSSPKEIKPAEKPISNSFMNSKNAAVPSLFSTEKTQKEKEPPAKPQETSVLKLLSANNNSPSEEKKPVEGSKPAEEKKPLFTGLSNDGLHQPKVEKPPLSFDSNQEIKPAFLGNLSKNSPKWGSSDSKKPDSLGNDVKITPFSNSNSETKGFSLFNNNNAAPEIKQPSGGGLLFGGGAASAPKEGGGLFGNSSTINPLTNNQSILTNNTNAGGLFSNLNNNNVANNNSKSNSENASKTGLFGNLTGNSGLFGNQKPDGLFGNNLGGDHKGGSIFSGTSNTSGTFNNNAGGSGIFGNLGK